jgi:hypothetical protein
MNTNSNTCDILILAIADSNVPTKNEIIQRAIKYKIKALTNGK